jgi:hypothetical protein
MSFPKNLTNGCTQRISIGLTNIYIDCKTNTITVNHAGNMGNRIKNVADNVNKALGKGTWTLLMEESKSIKEEGSPDYLYTIIFRF